MSEAIGRPRHSTAAVKQRDVSDDDLGLFGPSTVTWRVHADPAMAFGGLRALLLQALHPVAMAGVAQHSGFQTDPWGRLLRTAEYVATVTYGTTAEVERAAARVRGIHRRLRGVEQTTGRAYRVDDADLLLWVHCCEADSFLTAFRHCGGKLGRSDADRYLAEQVRAAALVGLDPADVPASVEQMSRYFDRMRPQLYATTDAILAARFVLSPPMPLAARPAWLGVAALSFALLPSWARAKYGAVGVLSANPGTDLAAAVAGRSARSLLRLIPAAVRDSPARKAALRRARLASALHR